MSSVPWITSVFGSFIDHPEKDSWESIALLHIDCQDLAIIMWLAVRGARLRTTLIESYMTFPLVWHTVILPEDRFRTRLPEGEIGWFNTNCFVQHRHRLPAGYRVAKTPLLGSLHHEYRLEKEVA